MPKSFHSTSGLCSGLLAGSRPLGLGGGKGFPATLLSVSLRSDWSEWGAVELGLAAKGKRHCSSSGKPVAVSRGYKIMGFHSSLTYTQLFIRDETAGPLSRNETRFRSHKRSE